MKNLQNKKCKKKKRIGEVTRVTVFVKPLIYTEPAMQISHTQLHHSLVTKKKKKHSTTLCFSLFTFLTLSLSLSLSLSLPKPLQLCSFFSSFSDSTMTDSEKDAVPASPAATLYVGDLHSDVTDSQLYKAFSEFNTLISARVCKDSATGKSLCYGYVNLSSHQEGNKQRFLRFIAFLWNFRFSLLDLINLLLFLRFDS